MMPPLDGIATLKQLNANPATAAIPVISMTANIQSQEIQTYKTLGAIDTIPKPFNPMQLPQNLESIWRHHVR